MSKHLQHSTAPDRRCAKGWTPERRLRQAARIRLTQPWRHSTGPRTQAGKARVAMNALRRGYRSRAWILRARRIRAAIRLCADTLLLARAMIRKRDAETACGSWSGAVWGAESLPSGNAPVRFMSLIS